MVVSQKYLSAWSIYLVRSIIPIVLVAELYLHVHVIAPVLYGVGTAYYVYLAVLTFIVANLVGNVLSMIRTETSIHVDTCLEPELNVKLCSMCDRNVPPRCTHCEHCNVCVPRRRAHFKVLGTCIGYFNHRYFFVAAIYCLFYSANAVAVSAIFYNRVLRNCQHPPTPIDHYPVYDDYEDCPLLFSFFISAFSNFFVLIFTIIILTIETEIIVCGKMKHETDALNYDRGLKKNMICTLGKRWYLVGLCPVIKSALPDMHAVLFCVGERPSPYVAQF